MNTELAILVADPAAVQYQHMFNKAGLQAAIWTGTGPLPAPAAIWLAAPDLAVELLNARLQPKWIQSTWAGVTPLVEALNQLPPDHQPVVTGLKGIFGPLAAEYVFSHLLARTQRHTFYQNQQLQRSWQQNQLPEALAGRTMLFIGSGDIAGHISLVAKAFGIHTIAWSREGKHKSAFDETIQDLALHLPRADVVINSLPDTPATKALVNNRLLDKLPSHCQFLNIGRGQTVDTAALIEKLNTGQLAGAVLDVFENEPVAADDPIWETPNLVITPHIAAVSNPDSIAQVFLKNLELFRQRDRLLYRIDPKKGY